MRRKNYPLKTIQHSRVKLCGSFQFNGANDPINRRGDFFTATRTGVGAFQIDFPDRMPGVAMGCATLQLAAATDRIVVLGPHNASASATTWTFVVLNGAGAAADVAADANNRLHFMLTFKNTSR